MPLTAPSSVGLYDGRFLAATEKVIVASMNYRLGAMGFLALPPAAPGNVGLWDQHLALSWLRGNVAAFGGDPARLTLFGESAGASSVSFHLLSPWSRPLFTQAVMQSGSANAPWALVTPEQARQIAQALGHLMGCPEGDDHAVVRCLQGKEFLGLQPLRADGGYLQGGEGRKNFFCGPLGAHLDFEEHHMGWGWGWGMCDRNVIS
uniref:Carboxylic ester hydrolase n=1 Tax=Sphenodon punctatus TaxID=8508 RepID=A0A8D0HG89_SPHPU